MEIIKYPARNTWAHIVERPHLDARMLGETVSDMLADIRCRGDEAVREYVRRFQGAEIGALEVSPEEMAEAEAAVSSELKEAIAVAGENISRFHASQTMETRKVETTPGVICWQKAVPIERVGLYIPGGTAPLFRRFLCWPFPHGWPVVGRSCCVPLVRPTERYTLPYFMPHGWPVSIAFINWVAYRLSGQWLTGRSRFRLYIRFRSRKSICNRGQAAGNPARGSHRYAGRAVGGGGYSRCLVRYGIRCFRLLSQAEHGADSQSILFTTDESL